MTFKEELVDAILKELDTKGVKLNQETLQSLISQLSPKSESTPEVTVEDLVLINTNDILYKLGQLERTLTLKSTLNSQKSLESGDTNHLHENKGPESYKSGDVVELYDAEKSGSEEDQREDEINTESDAEIETEEKDVEIETEEESEYEGETEDQDTNELTQALEEEKKKEDEKEEETKKTNHRIKRLYDKWFKGDGGLKEYLAGYGLGTIIRWFADFSWDGFKEVLNEFGKDIGRQFRKWGTGLAEKLSEKDGFVAKAFNRILKALGAAEEDEDDNKLGAGEIEDVLEALPEWADEDVVEKALIEQNKKNSSGYSRVSRRYRRDLLNENVGYFDPETGDVGAMKDADVGFGVGSDIDNIFTSIDTQQRRKIGHILYTLGGGAEYAKGASKVELDPFVVFGPELKQAIVENDLQKTAEISQYMVDVQKQRYQSAYDFLRNKGMLTPEEAEKQEYLSYHRADYFRMLDDWRQQAIRSAAIQNNNVANNTTVVQNNFFYKSKELFRSAF